MITISFVAKTLAVVCIICVIAIALYCVYLNKNISDVPGQLSNTDVLISSGVDDIKIICK